MHRSPTAWRLRLTVTFGAALLSLPAAYAQVAAPPPPAPAATQAPAAQQPARLSLQPLVEGLANQSGLSSDTIVCIYVQDAASGVDLADMNSTLPVAPASNNKLVTTAAGLSLLGPDWHFLTKIFAGGPVKDGTLEGDLIVYGGGDPGMGGRYLPDKNDVTGVLRKWADELKKQGITRITGNIVADDSYFDDQYFHPNWYPGERAEWYSAEVSALSFNDNCVDVNWTGKNLLPDALAGYTLNPPTNYVNFSSQVKVVAKGRSTERNYTRGADDNNIGVTGTLNADATAADSAAVHDGALYCVNVFKDVLTSQGITVTGNAIKTRGAAARVSEKPLISEGHTLLNVCETINQNSQNFYAECVLKTLGKERGKAGSFEAGADVVEAFCRDAGIYHEGHVAIDGSGLSSKNRVTNRQLVGVLHYMDTHGLKDKWRYTLPQGATRGSLKRRFIDTPEGKAVATRILGKTGLIGGVRSLSGIVTDAKGREMYYSIILNQLSNGDAAKGMKLIDDVAIKLAASDL